MRYLDVCAGISASTVAWSQLGWEAAAYSEIEAAPRAILAHYYPDTPLHGDFSTIEGDEYGPIDLLVGGTPCQDYSVAGLRAGLAGDRGNLTLEFSRLAYRSRAKKLVWENVPGVFSSNGGRDFGAVLASFAGYPIGTFFSPPDGGWRNSGIVEPANRHSFGLAWRVLDAQHFGVPQRRRRVFIVGYLGDWRRAAAVLFEQHSLSGDPAPRRETAEDTASCLAGGARQRGGYSADDIPAIAGTISAAGSRSRGAGTDPAMLAQDVAGTLNASGKAAGSATQQDAESGLLVAQAFKASHFTRGKDGAPSTVVPPLSADADKGDQDTLILTPLAFDTTQITSPGNYSSPNPGGLCHPLAAGSHPPAICFSAKDHGGDALEDLAPTLRAGGHNNSHASGGVMPAVAFDLRGRDGGAQLEGPHDTANIRAASGGSSRSYVAFSISENANGFAWEGDAAASLQARTQSPTSNQFNGVRAGSAVRRLTPRECERLQGFPDDYTLIPHRKGMMADGPRYKALGNSMAVPVMRWIGERIQAVDALYGREARAA